jgi:predicted nuclease with TOPRIM domain
MNELERENKQLRDELEELRDELLDLTARFEAFVEPCAIGSEQLWEVVFNDILKRPVPSGVDLRDMI